jgi:hypothetical protein
MDCFYLRSQEGKQLSLAVNYLAVVVAAFVNSIIGSLWYGVIFGKPWQKLSGFSEMKGTRLSVILGSVRAFLTSYILEYAIFIANGYIWRWTHDGNLQLDRLHHPNHDRSRDK